MVEGKEWKPVFRMCYRLFEFLAMPIGLTNAPVTFQKFINDILRPFLNQFYMAFLDNILIYSNTFEKHHIHMRWVLGVLKMHVMHTLYAS